ncbi:MAG: winged helix-turn-helix transcriptional regulator [Candidatus Thorarchaeota archaeon]|nr:MAG: winged helix-turn-helix transcriptional regulator [Candidatus Thorarchaeota archaeon]
MDYIDKGILFGLLMNCRTPYRTLARNFNMTANAIKKRVQKLIDTGVIVQFTVDLSPAMIEGENFLAVISTDGKENQEEYVNRLGSHMLVREVGALSGSTYLVIGMSTGSESLRDLGSFFRGMENVNDVELHSLVKDALHGRKTELTKLQLRILRCLVENPRMSTGEIAERTGLTVRRTRTTINKLLDSGAVSLGIRWNLSAGEGFVFLLRISWDEKAGSLEDVLQFIAENFPVEFYGPMVSATEPVVFAAFVVEQFRDTDRISKKIAAAPFVVSCQTLLGRPPVSFTDIRRARLEEMIRAT